MIDAITVLPPAPLQWGHDNGVVERYSSSNFPPPSPMPLQWGHDNGVVERLSQLRFKPSLNRFNGVRAITLIDALLSRVIDGLRLVRRGA